MAVRLAPMRNRFLYPELFLEASIKLPQDQITSPKAAQLLQEVKYLVQVVKAKLKSNITNFCGDTRALLLSSPF